MSRQSVADDPTVQFDGSPTAPARRSAVVAVVAEPRLTVREIQIAIEAARSKAGRDLGSVPDAAEPVRERGADHSRATPDPDPRAQPEPWLPDHDGPVSLAGAAAPRIRAGRRAAATPDKSPRQRANRRSPARELKSPALDPELEAAATARPPRLIVVAACGGSGATTATVLLGAALAPVIGAVLVACADRGSLSVRANGSGGDVNALTAWTRQHHRQPMQTTTPGMAGGDVGTIQLLLAAAGRNDPGQPFDGDTAAALFTAAAPANAAVLLDWSSPTRPPALLWAAATHVLVVAPATSPGLLDAEYAVQHLAATSGRVPLSVLAVDVRGRAPRRAGRAALSRLQALNLTVTALPYDPALANDPRVHWPALRARTRSAVVATLAHIVHQHPSREGQP